jgi:predicted choloylglycine hydrolase
MGLHYGSLLYRHGFRLPAQPKARIEFGRQSEAEVRRLFPEVLDEIQGFSEACHASYDALLAFMLAVGIEEKSIRCSVFAARGRGSAVFGRNYDFFYGYKDFAESCLTVPEGGHASTGHSDVFIGKEDGVNETMLAVGMAFVPPVRVKPGVNFPIVVRYILDRCSSVEQAVASLKSVSYSTTNNYLLADATGDMAVVEAGPGQVNVRRPHGSQGFVACTNHFISQRMRDLEDRGKRVADSLRRYASMINKIEEADGHLDLDGAGEILSDDSGGVCSHRSEISLGTLWSVVADLKDRRIMVAEGHPCKTKYREDSRLRDMTHR